MRIFVLEDEVLLAMHIEDELTDAGHEIIGPASTIAEAEALIADNLPDFAILDINVNGESSASIANQLMEKKVSIAYLSGYDKSYIQQNLPEAPILSKPLDMRRLNDLLKQNAD